MTTAIITPDKLALIERVHLEYGSHPDFEAGVCAMELVAYIADEPFSDHPACVCPVLGAFVRTWNDRLSDGERDATLKPILTRLIGTKGSEVLEVRRALMAADWLVRVNAPAWLRLAKLGAHADTLSALPEITTLAQATSIRGPIEAAGKDARDAWDAACRGTIRTAAWTAAWTAAMVAAKDAALVAAKDAALVAAAWTAAAGDAAWTAAGDTAWTAAGDTAWTAAAWTAAWTAAKDAAMVAAKDAAMVAAKDAAMVAAKDALKETRLALQHSAAELLEKMIEASDQPEPTGGDPA